MSLTVSSFCPSTQKKTKFGQTIFGQIPVWVKFKPFLSNGASRLFLSLVCAFVSHDLSWEQEMGLRRDCRSCLEDNPEGSAWPQSRRNVLAVDDHHQSEEEWWGSRPSKKCWQRFWEDAGLKHSSKGSGHPDVVRKI